MTAPSRGSVTRNVTVVGDEPPPGEARADAIESQSRREAMVRKGKIVTDGARGATIAACWEAKRVEGADRAFRSLGAHRSLRIALDRTDAALLAREGVAGRIADRRRIVVDGEYARGSAATFTRASDDTTTVVVPAATFIRASDDATSAVVPAATARAGVAAGNQ